MPKVTMTAEEFDSLGERLGRLTLESVAIARAVLVDGISKFVVAQQHNITKPRVGAIVERVLVAAQDVPRDWVRVGVWLPPELRSRYGSWQHRRLSGQRLGQVQIYRVYEATESAACVQPATLLPQHRVLRARVQVLL